MVGHIKYTCPFCKHTCNAQYMLNHIATKHKVEMQKKYRYESRSAINHKKAMNMEIELDKQCKIIHCCFGCNKFWERKNLALTHFMTCEKKKEHYEVCKSFHENVEENQESVGEQNTEALMKLQEQINQLQEQNKKLKRNMESMEAELADCQQKVDAFDGLVECIYDKVNEEERDEWRDWLKSNKEGIEWEDYL